MSRTVVALLLALCGALTQVACEDDPMTSVEDLVHESKCLETENLTMDEVSAYALGKNFEVAESKPQLKCFAACLFEFSGILDGCSVNAERFAGKDNAELQKLHKLLAVCKGSVNAGDRCECAHQLAKCMVEQDASAEGDN